MKKVRVLLLQDVRGTGKRGDVAEVSAGFAAHALLPRGEAVYTDARVIRDAQMEKDRIDAQKEKAMLKRNELLKIIDKAVVTLKAKANEKGILYGSITRPMLAQALAKQHLPVAEDSIDLPQAITTCGKHHVTVRIDTVRSAALTVDVQTEEQQCRR